MSRIKVDIDTCTGCGICELACSVVKERVYNPVKARIQVVKRGLPAQVAILVCAQCRKAACVAICPTHAIVRKETTGAWEVDETLCIGCELCIDACPLDAIKIHPLTGSAIKCDLCGGKPLCVERCPRGALSLSEEKPKPSRSVERMIYRSLEKNGFSMEQFFITELG